jgi:hypothetical protein
MRTSGPSQLIGALLLVASIVSCSRDSSIDAQKRPSQIESTDETSSPGAVGGSPEGSFALFAGRWQGHEANLSIEPNGEGRLDWRTYRSCEGEDGPGPCDLYASSERPPYTPSPGNQQGPARTQFRLRDSSGARAMGSVTASNEPTMETGSRVAISRVRPGDVEIDAGPFESVRFCSDGVCAVD